MATFESKFSELLTGLQDEHAREVAFLKEEIVKLKPDHPLGETFESTKGKSEGEGPSEHGAHRRFDLWSTYSKKLEVAGLINDEEEPDNTGILDIDDELEAEKAAMALQTPWFILNPNCRERLVWDLAGVVVLVYDLVMIPVKLSFEPEDSPFTVVLGWCTMIFWTLDMFASFFVGYQTKDGTMVVKPCKIVKHYVTTWFPLDIVIVSVDWLIMIVGNSSIVEVDASSAGLIRAGKMLRALRILRTLRLLRLAKLRVLLNKLQDRVDSEYMAIVLSIFKLLIIIIFINHFIACTWYFIGISPPANDIGWVEVTFGDKDAQQKASTFFKYGTSMHWSLTQFTPASMSVQPANAQERNFAIAVLLFAMIVFSSFVASLTGAMTSLRNMTAKHTSQLWLMRKFMRQRQVSSDLALRINRYINVVIANREKFVQSCDVGLLNMLSVPLTEDLKTELNKPKLVGHPLFRWLDDHYQAILQRLAVVSSEHTYISRGDVLFHSEEEAHSMFFLLSGNIIYTHVETKLCGLVSAEEWFCESVLWTPWVHQGRSRARNECELLTLSTNQFQNVLLEFPANLGFAKKYGLLFLTELANLCDDNNGLLTDMDMGISSRPSVRQFLHLDLSSRSNTKNIAKITRNMTRTTLEEFFNTPDGIQAPVLTPRGSKHSYI
eukprot:TRINITY_DN23289_c0_g4_i1.p1 TRINITY_DN23289_c0_g4~~TRINITY_DN23289_c0_g4_i1.p1  ORF type:complete len:664 (+),score=118.38 TRINITY_DN23289_c0_g4_i1:62-2053(+)